MNTTTHNRSNKLTLLLSFAIGLTMLAGCARDVANRYYAAQKYAARTPGEVAVLWESPKRAYDVIADFQSRNESPKDIQEKAAAIGADAVIVSVLGGHYSLKEQWAGNDRHDKSYSRITGTAIRYR